MNTYKVLTCTYVDSIPMGRRIAEILREKGAAFTQQAFAKRLDYNRETFRKMLNGTRDIYEFELNKIREILRVSLERIIQSDIVSERAVLLDLLNSLEDNEEALRISEYMLSVSLGLTERCIALDNKGRALYLLQRYEEAHSIWLEAYDLAIIIYKLYDEEWLLFSVSSHLALTLVVREDYYSLSTVISKIKPFFDKYPDKTAPICYSLAKLAEEKKDLMEAKIQYYRSLEYYKRTGNQIQIGGALVFVANFETRIGNYQTARELYEEAVTFLTNDKLGKIICLKEYAKNLLENNQKHDATKKITLAMELAYSEPDNYRQYIDKLKILLSLSEDNPMLAIEVAESETTEIKLRNLACEVLMVYYDKRDDNQSLVKYYRMRMGFEKDPILLKGGLL